MPPFVAGFRQKLIYLKKLDYIDSLRGLAILGVIMIHTTALAHRPLFGNSIIDHGANGVQLFFVVSAFTLFLTGKSRFEKEQFAIKNFFIRRFFRIAPMFYLGIIYYLFQNGTGPRYWLGDATHISAFNIFSNFLFIHGFNPYWINSVVPGGWSIAVEMTFYLILPFLLYRLKSLKDGIWFLNFTLLLSIILNIVFRKYPFIQFNRLWGEYLFFYFPSQLPVFAVGIIMYFLLYGKNQLNKNLAASLLFLVCIFFTRLVTGLDAILPFHIFLSIGFLLLGISLSQFKFKLIVNPVIQFIGKISFSMYLIHFAVIFYLQKFGLSNFSNHLTLNYYVQLLLILSATVLISSITYKWIEIPFQKLGRKIISSGESKAFPVLLNKEY